MAFLFSCAVLVTQICDCKQIQNPVSLHFAKKAAANLPNCIVRESTRDDHQAQGGVERWHRTLQRQARALLIQSLSHLETRASLVGSFDTASGHLIMFIQFEEHRRQDSHFVRSGECFVHQSVKQVAGRHQHLLQKLHRDGLRTLAWTIHAKHWTSGFGSWSWIRPVRADRGLAPEEKTWNNSKTFLNLRASPSEPTADRTNEPMFPWDQPGLSRRSWCDIIFRRLQRAFALMATSTLLKTDVSGPECWLANSCQTSSWNQKRAHRKFRFRHRPIHMQFHRSLQYCPVVLHEMDVTTPLEESPSFAETRPREEPV